jgi:pimeloyl-ACP methyl ester carboxylesterase
MGRLVAAAQRAPLAGEEADIAALEGEERYRATTAAKLAAMDPRALVDLAAAISQQASLVARLGEIRCPTTVLVGESDLRFLPLADELAAGIPGAVLVRIPGGGHSPQRSARAAWLTAVRAHVERARAGA